MKQFNQIINTSVATFLIGATFFSSLAHSQQTNPNSSYNSLDCKINAIMIGISLPPEGDGSAIYLLPCEIEKKANIRTALIARIMPKKIKGSFYSSRFKIEVNCNEKIMRSTYSWEFKNSRRVITPNDESELLAEKELSYDWESVETQPIIFRALDDICSK